jgi:hypothetical protein
MILSVLYLSMHHEWMGAMYNKGSKRETHIERIANPSKCNEQWWLWYTYVIERINHKRIVVTAFCYLWCDVFFRFLPLDEHSITVVQHDNHNKPKKSAHPIVKLSYDVWKLTNNTEVLETYLNLYMYTTRNEEWNKLSNYNGFP